MSVVDDTRQRLLLAREKLRFADACIGLALDALAKGKLMDAPFGLSNHERVRQNARAAETDTALARAMLEVVVRVMDKVGRGTL